MLKHLTTIALVALITTVVTQQASARSIELNIVGGGPIYTNIPGGSDAWYLSFIYATTPNPDAPNLLSARLTVGNLPLFSCGTFKGVPAPTACGGGVGLSYYDSPVDDPEIGDIDTVYVDHSSIDGTGLGSAATFNIAGLYWQNPDAGDWLSPKNSNQRLPTPQGGAYGGAFDNYFWVDFHDGITNWESESGIYVTSRWLPEPGTLLLLGLGLAGLGLSRRKQSVSDALDATTNPA